MSNNQPGPLFYSKWFNAKFKKMLIFIKEEKSDPFLLSNIASIKKYYEDTCPAIVNIFRDYILSDEVLSKKIKKKDYKYFINYINDEDNKFRDNKVFVKLHKLFVGVDTSKQKQLMDHIEDLRRLTIHYVNAE